MNLSQEYIDLMERLLKEGQNYGILLTPNPTLINADCSSEIDLISSAAEAAEAAKAAKAAKAAEAAKAMEDLKKPAEKMRANLTSTLMGNGFTLQEAKVISGEEKEDPK